MPLLIGPMDMTNPKEVRNHHSNRPRLASETPIFLGGVVIKISISTSCSRLFLGESLSL